MLIYIISSTACTVGMCLLNRIPKQMRGQEEHAKTYFFKHSILRVEIGKITLEFVDVSVHSFPT